MTEEEFAAFVAAAPWRFAATMPQWPLEQILSQCTVSEVDALLLRELQSSTEFRRYAFAPPVQVA